MSQQIVLEKPLSAPVHPEPSATEELPKTKTKKRGNRWDRLAREAAILVVLCMLYWFIASISEKMSTAAAFTNAHHVWRLERFIHLPSETWVQSWSIASEKVTQFGDLYYLVHFPVTGLALLWLVFFNRRNYYRARTELAVFTCAAVLLMGFYPVAPPRLVDAYGMVDTLNVVGPISVYTVGSDISNELAAMPSIHVGWAIWVAIVVTRAYRSKYRYLVWLHPALTTFSVVISANHYWLDGIVAWLMLAIIGAVTTHVYRKQNDSYRSLAATP